MNIRSRKTELLTAFAVAFLGAGLAHAGDLPPVHDSGHVKYVTGGIGQDESTAMKAAERHWPLSLEFAQREGKHADYVADVHVTVRNASGHAALKTKADGPFMLAKLPPGRYTVEASLGGKTYREPVVIKHGAHAHATFVWPQGTDNPAV